MAAKKTAKQASKKATPRDLGKATGVAEARRSKKKGGEDDPPPDMADVFHQTAEEDAAEAKMSESAQSIKRTHLLAMEQEKRLRAARMSTSTHFAIKHDLERVIELTGEIADEAQSALDALGR